VDNNNKKPKTTTKKAISVELESHREVKDNTLVCLPIQYSAPNKEGRATHMQRKKGGTHD